MLFSVCARSKFLGISQGTENKKVGNTKTAFRVFGRMGYSNVNRKVVNARVRPKTGKIVLVLWEVSSCTTQINYSILRTGYQIRAHTHVRFLRNLRAMSTLHPSLLHRSLLESPY
eukprot:6181419-Pleurochrysis_carterae.AAC.5